MGKWRMALQGRCAQIKAKRAKGAGFEELIDFEEVNQ
jgi:hypothetical protein